MGQAGNEAHSFSTVKYIVGTVTVTLQISLEVLQQFPYSLSRTGAVIVMENDQLFHDRPDHPQILLVGLPLSLADYPYSGLVRLNIPVADNQPDQLVIKWSQQFTHRLEPAAQRAFGKTDPQMAELLDLPVTVQIHPVGFNHHFNYRQSLQEFTVTPGFLLLSIGLCF